MKCKMKPVSECLELLYEKGYILNCGGINFAKKDGIHSKYLQTYVLNSCGKEVEPIEGLAFLYDEIVPQGKELEGKLCGFSEMSLEDARESARLLRALGIVCTYGTVRSGQNGTKSLYTKVGSSRRYSFAYPVRKADITGTLIID